MKLHTMSFFCKKIGKHVTYVSRGLIKLDDQPINQVVTALERFMAGEYSRQLSSKVFRGCCYIARQGYSENLKTRGKTGLRVPKLFQRL